MIEDQQRNETLLWVHFSEPKARTGRRWRRDEMSHAKNTHREREREREKQSPPIPHLKQSRPLSLSRPSILLISPQSGPADLRRPPLSTPHQSPAQSDSSALRRSRRLREAISSVATTSSRRQARRRRRRDSASTSVPGDDSRLLVGNEDGRTTRAYPYHLKTHSSWSKC